LGRAVPGGDLYGSNGRRNVSSGVVSIVVPTRNAMQTLPAVFDAIRAQRAPHCVEVIVVDSSSTDGTAEFARARADGFISIPADRFNHGTTRNLGIEQARGDLVVMLVQDALPASVDWLAALIAPFDDASVAGSFAQQQPRADADAVTRYYLERWVAASDEPQVTAVNDLEYSRLPASEQMRRCTFDNVCSCLRRRVWVDYPFRPTPIAEDLEWGRRVLLAGYKLAFVPHAVVLHSHDRSPAYEFERTRLLHRRLFELFGLRTIPSRRALVRAIACSMWLHVRLEAAYRRPRQLRRVGRGVALAVMWPLGQYVGGREGARQSPTPSWRITSHRV